jgi:hypothetical protein
MVLYDGQTDTCTYYTVVEQINISKIIYTYIFIYVTYVYIYIYIYMIYDIHTCHCLLMGEVIADTVFLQYSDSER